MQSARRSIAMLSLRQRQSSSTTTTSHGGGAVKRFVSVACALTLVPYCAVCFGQGLLPDPPALVASAPAAEVFRGVLPPRIDLSPLMPPPRLQSPSRTCVSWAVTYAAASDALRRADPGGNLACSAQRSPMRWSAEHRTVSVAHRSRARLRLCTQSVLCRLRSSLSTRMPVHVSL